MKEFKTPEYHQDYLENFQREIQTMARSCVSLESQLGFARDRLNDLIRSYKSERYRRQIEIWRGRGLTRCTMCYDIPPDKMPSRYDERVPTAWGGWGLIPLDDVHHVLISGKHSHCCHECSSEYTALTFHQLCSNCYEQQLKACATGYERMRDLTKEEVEKINQVLTSNQKEYEVTDILRKKFGDFNEIRVVWAGLRIPEGAYEIGQPIEFEELLKQLRQTK